MKTLTTPLSAPKRLTSPAQIFNLAKCLLRALFGASISYTVSLIAIIAGWASVLMEEPRLATIVAAALPWLCASVLHSTKKGGDR